MKKFTLLLLLPLFFVLSCNKDEETDEPQEEILVIKQVQWGFAINYTATWCGPCGSWGAPLIHELYEEGNVVAITAHALNDPMYNGGLYNSFNADRPSDGFPTFYVGDTKTTSVGTMTSLLEEAPTAAVAIHSINNGSSMTVKTKTEFFEPGIGDFYLSVLILEDGIDGSSSAGAYEQNGVSDPSDYHHDFVLRASNVENNAYGAKIIGDPGNGDIVENEYEIALDPSWVNVYAVAVLWRIETKKSTNYLFVNAIK